MASAAGQHDDRVVDAVLSGVHERGGSHLALLAAFAPRAVLERALDRADAAGYLGHEQGDRMLVFGAPPAAG